MSITGWRIWNTPPVRADIENTEVKMKKIAENLANLVKVKTIVTLAVIAVFVALAVRRDISADNVMIIVTSVISFYFGTQHERKEPMK